MQILPLEWPPQYEHWLGEEEPLLRGGKFVEAFRSYPWVTFTAAPLTTPRKPLAEMTVAAISSGGLSIPEQQPFDDRTWRGDASFLWIPGPGPIAQWRVDHAHYDPGAAREDYNTILPLDVLRELALEGAIGATAPRHVSFMGYQTDPQPFLATSAEEVASGLREDGVDAVLLVPV